MGQPDTDENELALWSKRRMGQGQAERRGRFKFSIPPKNAVQTKLEPLTDKLMRSSKSRSRNKSNRQRSLGNIVNRVFDSSGPEGKVRGTPQQIIDKYLALARDAQLSGDRVAEQSFFQHAEHYTRMLGEAQREMAERQQQHQHQNPQNQQGHQNQRQNGDDDRDGRDQGREAPQMRDGGDDQPQPSMPEQATGDQPRPAETAQPQKQRRPRQPRRDDDAAPALPDAVGATEGEDGPVATPEIEAAPAKPVRARAPRAPRGENAAAPRSRRKPAAAPANDTPPAGDSAEQG